VAAGDEFATETGEGVGTAFVAFGLATAFGAVTSGDVERRVESFAGNRFAELRS